MLGLEKQQGLFDVSQIAPGLVDSGSVYGLLAARREELFPASDFGGLFPSSLGRPSIPPAVMCSALLLQALDSLTDREAAEALTFDLRWKAACGTGVNVPAFHFSAFSYWRGKIAASDRPDLIGQAVAKVVEECGVLRGKKRRAVDSTVLDDAVARQDTVTLLARQVRAVARVVPGLAGWIGSLPGGEHYQPGAGKPDIDWDDKASKEKLVCTLVNDALAVVGRAEAITGLTEVQRDAVGLLALLAGQDVEPAEGSDGSDGRWTIAKNVAKDRVLSTVDPDARHARKTRSDKRDGFKAHVVVEPDTGIITAAKLTKAAGPGCADGQAGAGLLAEDLAVAAGEVDEVLADGAYATVEMYQVCDQVGAFPVIKPQLLIPVVPGGFTIDDFAVDPEVTTVTCPAGQTRRLPASGQASFRNCGTCPLKPRCTTSNNRAVHITDRHLAQREHRSRVADAGKVFSDSYRSKRPMVERSIAWLTRKARRVPYRGAEKNDAWLEIRVAAINLKRLLNLGLRHDNGVWQLMGTV